MHTFDEWVSSKCKWSWSNHFHFSFFRNFWNDSSHCDVSSQSSIDFYHKRFLWSFWLFQVSFFLLFVSHLFIYKINLWLYYNLQRWMHKIFRKYASFCLISYTIIVVQTNSITTEFIKYRLITDFRNYSSLAQLQADWRTNTFRNSWNIQFSYWSTWMKFTSSWYWWIYATIPFAISWTNKIHFKLTWNWSSNSAIYSNICSKNTPDLSSNDMTEVNYRLPFSWKTSQWLWCNKTVWSTKYREIFSLNRPSYNWVNWDFEYEFDIDLNTNAVSWKCSAPSSAVYEMSWTLNTEWRNAIIWTKFLCLRFANYSSATNYLYTSELIIR